MSKKAYPDIKAGAALLAFTSKPTELDSYVTVEVADDFTGYEYAIEVTDVAPISGIVGTAASSRQAAMGIIRETGENVICFDTNDPNTTVQLIRSVGLHPNYKERGQSTFLKDISIGDHIDFYAYFTLPAETDYIEVTEAVDHSEEQDTFTTMDNSEEFDTIASAPSSVVLSFTAPRAALAHPNSMGEFFVDERIVYDRDTSSGYTRKKEILT